jgi:hypothetical protein
MPLRLRAILLSFALCSPALAWEPQSPAAVQSRIEELQKAWAGKSPEEIAQDKVARSRQSRPQWASKRAWKMDLGPVTYYFAVGKAGFPRAAAAGGADSASGAPPGRPLDWWFDDASATFYSLVVDAR